MGPYDRAAVSVLIRREVQRFFRQISRVSGALMQPLLFWLILGSGFAPNFQMKGAESLNYLEYFFPGVVAMMVLFTAIFSTMTLIEDRAQGFLQAVLAGPCRRSAVVLGKVLGGTTVALIQVFLFILLAPLAGFHYSEIAWIPLFAALFLTAVSFTAFGFFLAWALNSMHGYHAIMSVVLIPLWLLSGAPFPINVAPIWLKVIGMLNPMTYSVAALRSSFYTGGIAPGTQGPLQSGLAPYGVLVLVALFNFWLAARVCRRSRA